MYLNPPFLAVGDGVTGDQKKGLAEIKEMASIAQRARSVARTEMNAESSRSHSVFTLWLTGYDASTGTTLKVSSPPLMNFADTDEWVGVCILGHLTVESYFADN